jgi:hypothetical protein
MSVATQKPSRNHGRGQHREAGSVERRRHALAQQAARQRRDRAQQRDRQQQHIIGLLRRGAGISQILWEIGRPQDRLSVSVARALHVRRILDAVAADAPEAQDVKIPQRDLTRILAYLDGEISRLQHDAAAQQRRAAAGRHARRAPARRARA